jgi:hypothetical protein
LQQFNQFYKEAQLWSFAKDKRSEWEAIRVEIAKMLYNQHLHVLEVQVIKDHSSFISRWCKYSEMLLKINPELFYFPQFKRCCRIQELKKNLLVRRQFKVFAFLVMLRAHFRKLV